MKRKRKPKVVAILPMKKNSVRCPGKNVRNLGGRPLWHWITVTTMNLPFVDRLVIDTDMRIPDLQMPAIRPGVNVTWKPRAKHLRGDRVHMDLIIQSVIRDHPADIYMQVHATSPFVSSGAFERGFNMLIGEGEDCPVGRPMYWDSVMAVTPIQARCWYQGAPVNHAAGQSICTQDLMPVHVENSGFYMFRHDTFMETATRAGGQIGYIELTGAEAIDIDTENDFRLADAWAQSLPKADEQKGHMS